MLLLLHSRFILSMVKMALKGEVGGCALNSHGNYIVDHGKSWNNHGIVFLNFCGNTAFGIHHQRPQYKPSRLLYQFSADSGLIALSDQGL